MILTTCPALPTERQGEYFLPPDVILLTVDDGSARLLDMAGVRCRRHAPREASVNIKYSC